MKRRFFPMLQQKCLTQPCWILLAALLLAMPAVSFGQGYFGTVTVVLTDPAGAVIPGAKLTLTDQNKGYAFNAASDAAGRYLYRSVPPGVYSVTAEISGFEKTVRTGIRVDVNQNATANLRLKVSTSSQTVEVHSQSGGLDAQDATTGLVIDRKFINDLPLVDRYVMDLTMLTPGVTETDDQCSIGCTGTNFVSNGSRNSTADVLMDGATITNFEPNGGVTNVTYTPSSEAVDEFRVEQSNFSAEYGFSGASVVNMITRSGSNTFHGGVYDFVRNTITDANNWFNDQSGIPIPPVHRHNFGGTVGGPIFKNKTFFFFDYDATRQSSMGTYQAGVPTDAERNNGDFGEGRNIRQHWHVLRVGGANLGSLFRCVSSHGPQRQRRRGSLPEHLHPVQQHRQICEPRQSEACRYSLPVIRRSRRSDRPNRSGHDEVVSRADQEHG
jgi:hypothetical protein